MPPLNAKALLHEFVQQNPAAAMPEVSNTSCMLPGNQPRFEATYRLREGTTRAGKWFAGGEFRGVAFKKRDAEQAAAAMVLAHLAEQGAVPAEVVAGIAAGPAAGGGETGGVPPPPGSLPQPSVAPTVRLTTTTTTATAGAAAALAGAPGLAHELQRQLVIGTTEGGASAAGAGSSAAAPPAAAVSGGEAAIASINLQPPAPASDLPPLRPVSAPYVSHKVGVGDVELMGEDELRERLTQALLQNQRLGEALDAVMARHREALRLLRETTAAVAGSCD